MTTPKLLAEFERLYPPTLAGSKAAYRREDYVFPREQSRAMRNCAWEEPEPAESITAKFVKFNIGFWLLFGPFLAVATGYWK